jgi:hypothetical protein
MSITNEPSARAPNLAIPASDNRTRRRWWWRWTFRVFLALLIGSTLLVWSYAHSRREAMAAVRAAVAELDGTDASWRLQDIEAARPFVPHAENSAPVVSAVYRLIPRDWPPADLAERVASLSPEVQLDEDTDAWLLDELCQNQDALLEGRKLAALANGRHPITYTRNILDTLLPHTDHTRKVCFLLRLDVVAQAHQGDCKGALRSCRALLNAARSLGDEPLMVTQLVRIAGVVTAFKAVERVLAQSEPDFEDVMELQKLLEAEERFPRLVVAMRGERGCFHEIYDALERGDVKASDLERMGFSRSESLQGFSERDFIRAHHADSLAVCTEMIRIATLPPNERDGPIRALDATVLTRRNILTGRLLLPAFGKMNEAAVRTDASLHCLIAAVAAEHYRLRHGRFPETLDRLVPDFLRAVPLDPKDGQALGYQHLPNRVVI